MNHEDRLRLIFKPFFITTIHPVKRWAGTNTGGYVIADCSGGHQVGAHSTSHEGRKRGSPQWGFNTQILTLWDAQQAILIGDGRITKFNAEEFAAGIDDFNDQEDE